MITARGRGTMAMRVGGWMGGIALPRIREIQDAPQGHLPAGTYGAAAWRQQMTTYL